MYTIHFTLKDTFSGILLKSSNRLVAQGPAILDHPRGTSKKRQVDTPVDRGDIGWREKFVVEGYLHG